MGDDLNADQKQDLFRLCMFLEGENKKLKEREILWGRATVLSEYMMMEMGRWIVESIDKSPIYTALDLRKVMVEIEELTDKLGCFKSTGTSHLRGEDWVVKMDDLICNSPDLKHDEDKQ